MSFGHLSRAARVDLAEGALPTPRAAAHLRRCASCRDEVAALSEVLDRARNVPGAEPSPLFWAHFPERVTSAIAASRGREETAASWPARSPVRASATGRRPGTVRWLTAAGLLAVPVVLLALVLVATKPGPPAARVPVTLAPAAGEPTAEARAGEDGAWLVVLESGDFDWEAVADAGITPVYGAAERLASEMTPEEQLELARLLREEIAAGPS